jgi:hypothetical protein
LPSIAMLMPFLNSLVVIMAPDPVA